jgi:hypothetical protein
MAIPILQLRREDVNKRTPVAVFATAILALGASAIASAQETAAPAAQVVSVERLRFEKKCFFQVPEWKGKGAEDLFIEKLKTQRGLYEKDATKAATLPVLEALMAECLWDRKTEFEKDGQMDRADAMAAAIGALTSKDPKVEEYRVKADDFVIGRNFDKAKKAMTAGNKDEARKGFVNCRNARNPDIRTQVVTNLLAIAKKEVDHDAIAAGNDLEGSIAMYKALVGTLQMDLGDSFAARSADHPELKDVLKEKSKLEGSTQLIRVASIDVAGALGGVKGEDVDVASLHLVLVPVGPEGKAFGKPEKPLKLPKNPMRWIRGDYEIRAYMPDGKSLFAAFPARAVKDTEAVLQFPNKAPKGMLWVEPKTPGGEALFVDRYEVTRADVMAVAGDDEKLKQVLKDSNTGDNDPVWFFDEASALAYEKLSGKKIPTAAQWLHAAYGPFTADQRLYPWGKAPPDPTTVFAKKGDEPAAVGGRPAGASPYGIEDMAGNLAEWVRKDGQLWLLGGWYYMGEDGLQRFEGKFPLRDPMPGKAAYDALGAAQNEYVKYRYKVGDDGYYSGLRMVIPVPTK